MKQYLGTKLLNAEPMTLGEYNTMRGWVMPVGEEATTEGYLIEYLDGGSPNSNLFAGYISWSPKAVFERSYRPTTGLSFGLAIEAMRMGCKVARAGWNGKGMWLILVPGTPMVNMVENSPYMKAGITHCEILPHIDMWTTNAEGRRAMLPGWLASQTDMLSTDWAIIN